ncbi:malate dehydrogenase [Candidatus Woesearchaeota archaeon]|nr:malate dehydrogenase [Candidatus Woesearchaeota archaeon]|tara:strand:- start:78 stop:995 length:918 start_codon:yes stop_codon:yes gene_type:complete
MTRKKITIVGAGFVGSTAAHWIAAKGLADIILVDIDEGIAKGKALDLQQAMIMNNKDIKIIGTNSYEQTKGSDIVVVTAGIPRKPGMSRDELISINSKIVEDICNKLKEYCPDTILIIVTNPLDAMVYKVYKLMGLPKNKIVGMAGMLDSARFKHFICEATGNSPKEVDAMVLGTHNNSMVPLASKATINQVPLKQVLNKEKITGIIEKTKNGGAEIVKLLGKGSAYYTPGLGIMEMVEAILKDQKKLLPCTAYCEGEYGAKDIFIGVPVILGKSGVEEIVEMVLEEQQQMNESIKHIKKLIDSL